MDGLRTAKGSVCRVHGKDVDFQTQAIPKISNGLFGRRHTSNALGKACYTPSSLAE